MHALSRGWRDFGRPATRVALKLWASHRLDLALAITCQTLVPAPAGLGIALSRGLRLVVAARVARSGGGGQAVEDHDGDGSEASSRGGSKAQPLLAAASAGVESRSGGGSSSDPNRRSQQPPQPRKVPRGLPPLPLPRIPPGGLASCSTQPIGLPMMLVGQSAARAPLHSFKGDRLIRGLAGLAATLLSCRTLRTPFTGRRARLPPRIVEFFYSSVLGPAAAVSYLTTSAASGQGPVQGDCAVYRRYEPALRQLYSQLRQVGEVEALRGGRGLVFATKGPSVEAIQRSDVNACCLPGGIVFVHSGLIKAVGGRHDSLAFVLGHEVGHAIGRHSLEKATSLYTSMFGIDVVLGLAERMLRTVAPGESGEEGWVSGRLKTLDGLLQGSAYLLQLAQSRRHEYEADELALLTGAGAGLSSGGLLSGATDVMHKFMQMEGGAGGGATSAGLPQGDNPLSTHPAAANRLRRISDAYQKLVS